MKEKLDLNHFMPYLLQDLWELGSDPADFITLMENHIAISQETRLLDLACGKGAASIQIANSLNVKVTGFDLIPEFIEYAREKSQELSVNDLCYFSTGDINEIVLAEKGYDCVILGSVGDILGTPKETFEKLKLTIKPKGYILFYDMVLLDLADRDNMRYKENKYLTREEWVTVFGQSELKLIDSIPSKKSSDNDANNKAIIKRAHELAQIHPEKRSIFDGFINAQLDGSYDLIHSATGCSWLLQAL